MLQVPDYKTEALTQTEEDHIFQTKLKHTISDEYMSTCGTKRRFLEAEVPLESLELTVILYVVIVTRCLTIGLFAPEIFCGNLENL